MPARHPCHVRPHAETAENAEQTNIFFMVPGVLGEVCVQS